jgi:hypothetical protein
MNELHWTGAAVLLAAAVLSRGRASQEGSPIVSWDEMARQLRLRDAAAPTGDRANHEGPTGQPRGRAAATPPHLRAAAVCGHCGREAGELEWPAAAAHTVVWRAASDGPARFVPAGVRLRCAHCRGPVFAETPEPVARRTPRAARRPDRAARRAPLRAS